MVSAHGAFGMQPNRQQFPFVRGPFDIMAMVLPGGALALFVTDFAERDSGLAVEELDDAGSTASTPTMADVIKQRAESMPLMIEDAKPFTAREVALPTAADLVASSRRFSSTRLAFENIVAAGLASMTLLLEDRKEDDA